MGFALNTAALSGNLTRDPEVRQTPSGALVTNFSLAWNERRRQTDGNYEDVAHYFEITMWGKLGESIAQQVRKGDPIAFQGELRQDRWENEQGEKRSRVGMVAFHAMPGKRKERQGGGGFGAPPGGFGPPAGGPPPVGPPAGGPPPGAPATNPHQGYPVEQGAVQQGQPAVPARQQAWPGQAPPPGKDDIPF